MPFMVKKKKQIVYASSAAAAVVIALIGVLTYFSNPRLADYIFLIAIVVGLIPISILSFLENRWKSSIESRIPELLEDIAEGQLTGLTFLRALEASTMKNYGAVTEELKRIMAHVKLGGTIEEGFEMFAKRAESKMVRRASGIIVETTKSGGDVAKIIRTLASYLRQIEALNAERKGTMRTYVAIVFIAFGVFMTTVVILLNQFFYPMIGLGTAIFTPQAPYDTYRRIFYYMGLIQAIFSGLVTGKLGEGSIMAGFKYSVMMLVINLIIFMLLIAG